MRIAGCRACGETSLEDVLDLGATPLANALRPSDDLGTPEARYPLFVVFCPRCTLLQITETVRREQLFRDYPYFSSFSDTAVENARAIAQRMTAERRLGRDSLAAEIASNDGYLLQHYRDRGVPVLGVEPARNIASVANARGIRTIPEFFGFALAQRLRDEGVRPDVLHANNVLAHVADLGDVVAGMGTLIASSGMLIVEVPYVRDLVDHGEFDTIYHEHLCYFSVTALERLMHRHGLTLVDVERLPIHGGSIRIFARAPCVDDRSRPAVGAMLEEERRWGVASAETYRVLRARMDRLRRELLDLLGNLRRGGERIVAYGASAKGSTLLNCFGIGKDSLEFVVDRNPMKQGLYMPGTELRVEPPTRLLEAMPGYVLLLTWNFAEEILAQQTEYRRRGGRFIIPIPEPRIL